MAYWFIGIPLGWYIGFPVDFGLRGLWIGMLTAVILHSISDTVILAWFVDWNEACRIAQDRVKASAALVTKQVRSKLDVTCTQLLF